MFGCVTTDGFSALSAAFVIFVIKASGHRKTSGKVAAVSAAHLQGLEAGGHSRFSVSVTWLLLSWPCHRPIWRITRRPR